MKDNIYTKPTVAIKVENEESWERAILQLVKLGYEDTLSEFIYDDEVFVLGTSNGEIVGSSTLPEGFTLIKPSFRA